MSFNGCSLHCNNSGARLVTVKCTIKSPVPHDPESFAPRQRCRLPGPARISSTQGPRPHAGKGESRGGSAPRDENASATTTGVSIPCVRAALRAWPGVSSAGTARGSDDRAHPPCKAVGEEGAGANGLRRPGFVSWSSSLDAEQGPQGELRELVFEQSPDEAQVLLRRHDAVVDADDGDIGVVSPEGVADAVDDQPGFPTL